MLIPSLYRQLIARTQKIIRSVLVLCLALSLAITPQMIVAATLFVSSNLTDLEMDLGNVILKVDQIDSKLAISLNTEGALTVSQFHAKYASLTFKPQVTPSKSNSPTPNVLPENISLPLPILLQDGKIDTLEIIQSNKTQVFKQIDFNLHANRQSLQLGLNIAESPWGVVNTNLEMENRKPFPLKGSFTVHQEKSSTPYQLNADISGDLTKLKVHALHHYQPDATDFHIVPSISAEQQNLIAIDAIVNLEDQMPASLDVQLLKLDASHLHPQLTGQLNVNLHAEGSLDGQQPMQILLKASDSQINEQPLLLQAEATLRDFILTNLTFNAQLATNQVTIAGGLDANDPDSNTLRWDAKLPTLAAFMPGFAGNINAQGQITQLTDRMQHQYQFAASAFDLPGSIHIDQADIKGAFSSNETDTLETLVTIQGLSQLDHQGNQSRPINATLNLNGSLAKHVLALRIENADPTHAQLNLNSLIEGGLEQDGWVGQLSSLQSNDQKTIRLTQPAPITWHAVNGFSLQQLLLQVQDGNIEINHLRYQPETATNQQANLSSKGVIKTFPVQVIYDYFGMQSGEFNQQLSLNGSWNVTINHQLNADILLARAAGDLSFFDTVQQAYQPLGLDTLAIQLKAVNNQITANASISSLYAGNLEANATTALAKTEQGFILSQQAPLVLDVESSLQHLNWIKFHERESLLDGKLKLSLNANGTLKTPDLKGYINGHDLMVKIPSQGIALHNGQLNASFTNENLEVNQFDFDGVTGTLKSQGKAIFAKRPIQLDLKIQANRFTALSRTDRFIVLSGDGDMHFNEAEALINGQFIVHHGLFELPKAGKPTLDDDIIIVGQPVEASGTPIAIMFGELNIDFGAKPILPYDESKQFILRGQGLNAALSGKIKLAGYINQLEASGSLDVTGRYLAYGQLLNIETGQINFSGPISNAGINILAMRNLVPTKVGVKLTGNIKTPQLQLISEPETTTDNKLSLLVLGRPVSEAGNSELAMLSLAAGALLSQGESVPLQSKIANLAGLDSLDINGNSNTDYSLTVGKRISQRLMLGYEKSIFGLLNVAKLTYQLTQRIAIETKAGSENALDVVYSFSFD
jgi:translocation and assembly module TamB